MLTQKLAIVGGGVGMLSILDHIYSMSGSKFEIYVFMKHTTGVGEAYKQAPDEFIMNTRNDSISFFNHIKNFQDWIACNHPTLSSTDYFVPRRVFGNYLNEVKKNILVKLKKNKTNVHFLGLVSEIKKCGSIVSGNTVYDNFDAIFTSIGFGSSFPIKENISKIKSIPKEGTINIVGSGLSSIDWIILANKLRPDLHINVFSKNGIFPAVRSHFSESDFDNIFESKPELLDNPCLFKLLRIIKSECLKDPINGEADFRNLLNPKRELREELDIARTRIPIWQPLLYRSTKNYSKFFSGLPSRQKRLLKRHRSIFVNRRVMFPIRNAEIINSLIFDNKLTIEKKVVNKEFIVRENTIDCTCCYLALEQFLKSINVISNDGSTLVDEKFKACSKRNLYILGPATNIDNYFTEVSSLTYLHAKEAVSDFLSINFGESK
ncbi:FAD/NAD(P)-binding protein [Vibrio neptunius]|uniref:FAD/NAD(P)-binding protein n=1 Tax=Vibrio neptunius TaxID=170651 RepID=UPI0019CFB273|nr:FAD/NAD(P)-binding domain-containing protein [Vibrio neptunius]MBN3572013.1 FAD/NAD(P)-binding protein [Vibrio neptunius]